MKSARFGETLRVLARHNVEFIVVGMAAGILQGVPLTTSAELSCDGAARLLALGCAAQPRRARPRPRLGTALRPGRRG
jgi:hypothetical protein